MSTLCPDASVQLQATGGDQYRWTTFPSSQIGTISDINAQSPTVFPTNSQTLYIAQVTDTTTGCSAFDTVTVNVNNTSTLTLQAVNPTICQNDEVSQLTVDEDLTDFATFSWTISDPGAAQFANGSVATDAEPFVRIIGPATNATFTLTATTTGLGCTLERSVALNVFSPVQPNLLAGDACLGNEQVIGTIPPATQSGCATVYWFLGTIAQVEVAGDFNTTNPLYLGVSNVDTLTAISSALGDFSYTVACISINGCITLDEETYNVKEQPIADFIGTPTTVPFYNRTVQFDSSPSIGVDSNLTSNAYIWFFGDSDSTVAPETSPNPSHTFLESGTFPITLIIQDSIGCTSITIKNDYIEVLDPDYAFPTAFTPNGDGVNDVFRPLPNSIDNENEEGISTASDPESDGFIMQIFDRWGNLVYTTNDPLQGWAGTTQSETGTGTPFDIGIYAYKVTIVLPIGENGQPLPRNYEGLIHLLR